MNSKTTSIALALLVGLLPIFLPASSVFAVDESPVIGVKRGEMYPDFVLPTLDGELKRLSDYRGKKILLFHFASW